MCPFDLDVVSDLLDDSFSLQELDIPEPEYDILTYDSDEDEGCEGGACKI